MSASQVEKLKQHLNAAYAASSGASNRTLASYNFSQAIQNEFNLNVVQIVSSQGRQLAVINAYGYNPNNLSNKAIILYYENGDFFGQPYIMETIKNSTDTVRTIKTYYIDGELDSTVQTVRSTGTTTVVYSNANTARRGCGQLVADCIQDAYANYGWASVTGWVLTAFVPATAALVAVMCYDKNC